MVRMYNYLTKIDKSGVKIPAVCSLCQRVHDRLDVHLISEHKLLRQSDEFKVTLRKMREASVTLRNTIYFSGPHKTEKLITSNMKPVTPSPRRGINYLYIVTTCKTTEYGTLGAFLCRIILI